MSSAAAAQNDLPRDLPRRRVAVLGATGSVGRSALDLIRRHPERFQVTALTVGRDLDALAALAREFRPQTVALADPTLSRALTERFSGTGIDALPGADGVVEAASRAADWTLAAIVGVAGLAPTLAAAQRRGVVALANKESVVCAGALLQAAARRSGAVLLPVDSEHNALFQMLEPRHRGAVWRLALTASGGPFRDWPAAALRRATTAQALRHPTWSMGAKISVDCATLMNKGLEVIEASILFETPSERIEVLIHPQSIVHALVHYADGSVLAHLGTPDMRIPIAHALAWPERMATPVAALDLIALGRLDFAAPDAERFPALVLARQALAAGPAACVVLNAANEVAVQAFLDRRLGFTAIAALVARCLEAAPSSATITASSDLEEVIALDRATRIGAEAMLRRPPSVWAYPGD